MKSSALPEEGIIEKGEEKYLGWNQVMIKGKEEIRAYVILGELTLLYFNFSLLFSLLNYF